MTAPYLQLSESLSQETGSGRYNRKALVLLAVLGSFSGVALWNHFAGGEQVSTIAMSSLLSGARPSMFGRPVMQPMQPTSARGFLQPVRAEAVAKPKPKPKPTPPPFDEKAWLSQLEEQLASPEKVMVKFGGSTGGLGQKASVEEMYIMTWKNPKGPEIFEMPTGGAATMNAGENMVYLARKEHGIALGTQLRSKFKVKDYRIFRRAPNGEVQFIHPADGVFPEKVNPGRTGANNMKGSILGKDKYSR